MNDILKSKLGKSIALLALLAYLVALFVAASWSPESGAIAYRHISSRTGNDGTSVVAPVADSAAADAAVGDVLPPPADFSVCGRAAGHHRASWSRQQKYNACPQYGDRRRPLVLRGKKAYGKGSGDRLRTFLRAAQYARDKHVPLVVVADSWVMQTLRSQFFATEGRDWQARMEKSLCLKVVTTAPKRVKWTSSPKSLFYYRSRSSKENHEASQLQMIRTLFRHHNTGAGRNDTAVKSMCSGIDALFLNADTDEPAEAREERQRRARYSAIHLSKGKGEAMLVQNAKKRGCDTRAAREMTPDYVKSILGPLDMLAHPIVVVVDSHKESAVALLRLVTDVDTGPMIRIVPEEASWTGGDMTLAIMVSATRWHAGARMSSFTLPSTGTAHSCR